MGNQGLGRDTRRFWTKIEGMSIADCGGTKK